MYFGPDRGGRAKQGAPTDSELSALVAAAFGEHFCFSATSGWCEGDATVGAEWAASATDSRAAQWSCYRRWHLAAAAACRPLLYRAA